MTLEGFWLSENDIWRSRTYKSYYCSFTLISRNSIIEIFYFNTAYTTGDVVKGNSWMFCTLLQPESPNVSFSLQAFVNLSSICSFKCWYSLLCFIKLYLLICEARSLRLAFSITGHGHSYWYPIKSKAIWQHCFQTLLRQIMFVI